ncbi:MAG TPA: TIM barrel protein [Fimbriiglobus sp.]
MSPSRRTFLAASAAATVASSVSPARAAGLKGRVKQSLVAWCYMNYGAKWSLNKLCDVATSLGCPSVEIVEAKDFPTLRKHDLTCAIASTGMRGAFKAGWNNLRHRAELMTATTKAIDACAAAGVPRIIGFVGFKWNDFDDPKSGEISKEDGAKNSIAGLKEVAGLLEKKKVTLCIEHLNTRDASHPMKGHPGYQGDDLDYVAGILRKVGSPRVKLLFDVYHVQIMHGDVIRRIDECRDVIDHIHTAGVPGRNELDETQELNYPAIVRKLVAVGYDGYVGHEFLPTRNALQGLTEAVKQCDV